MSTWVVVSDLDGTLAEITHRRHFLDDKDWVRFYRAMVDDTPNHIVIHTYRALLASGYPGVIVTGRPFEFSDLTVEWLNKHGIPYDAIFMRRTGDYRADDIVKREILHSMRSHWGIEPAVVLDDRQRVVDMWRAEGITTLQVAPGDF